MLSKQINIKTSLLIIIAVVLLIFGLNLSFYSTTIKNVEYGKPDEISPTMYDTLTKLISTTQNPALTQYINSYFKNDGYISTQEYVLIAQQQLAKQKPLQSEFEINYSLTKAKADFIQSLSAHNG
ncbi:hypothetical protein [Pseudoalteromonas fuliginea]|uniref:hypothetical protein n=1 Tax=Pseudoalteromonas fuliginea TaxID=1872678 RepID=UPI0031740972